MPQIKGLKTNKTLSRKKVDMLEMEKTRPLSPIQNEVFENGLSISDAKMKFMKAIVSLALKKEKYNTKKAAEFLNMNRTSLVELKKALSKKFGKSEDLGDFSKCENCPLYKFTSTIEILDI